jgi:Rieske Fe-S protein
MEGRHVSLWLDTTEPRPEHLWDCPCHASRFGVDGEVLGGPAVDPLKPTTNARSAK